MQNSCTAYDFDTETEKCLRNANDNYFKMYSCTTEEKTRYINQSQKLTKSLKTFYKTKDYDYIICNSNLLEKYTHFLQQGELKILNSSNGLMYQTTSENILSNIYQTNFQILEILYNNRKPDRNISDGKLTFQQLKKENSQNLKLLKNKLDKEQYLAIMNSQHAWQIYKKDVETNILPLIKNKPELQTYIKRLIMENRHNTLLNVTQVCKD